MTSHRAIKDQFKNYHNLHFFMKGTIILGLTVVAFFFAVFAVMDNLQKSDSKEGMNVSSPVPEAATTESEDVLVQEEKKQKQEILPADTTSNKERESYSMGKAEIPILRQQEQPKPPATRQAPTCDPSYPTVCIPPYPPDLDCGEIRYANFEVAGSDPHGFDRDRDGIGCES